MDSSTVIDPTKINMAVPLYNADKIIGIFSGTINVPTPTAGQGVLYDDQIHITGFNDSCLTQAIYSIDGGVTWNDDNTSIPYTAGGSPVFQTLDVSSFSRFNEVGIAFNNWYNNITSSGTAYTVVYKIFCLSKSNQGNIITLQNDYSLYYTSTDNYLKILSEAITPTIAPATPAVVDIVIPHSLGYTPTARGYIEYPNGDIWPASINQFNQTGFAGNSYNPVSTSIQLGINNVTYEMTSIGADQPLNLYSVVYLDA